MRRVTVFQRTHRASNPDTVAQTRVPARLDRQGHSAVGQCLRPIAQADPRQGAAISSEGVGSEDVCASRQVIEMNLTYGFRVMNQRRSRPQRQRCRNVTPLQFGAGCAVEQNTIALAESL